jgi:hypothetical protein
MQGTRVKETSSNSGIYEILIEPDSYWLFIKKFGYLTQKKTITAKAGEQVLKYSLTKTEVF